MFNRKKKPKTSSLKKLLLLTLFAIFFFQRISIAQFSIEGQVLDDKNQPLPGAVVQLKNADGGTQADADGKFSLTVPADVTAVIISFAGYIQQEVSVSAQSTTLSVTLQPEAQSLNEVVVVGYGTQKKRDVTGSVVSVDNKTLQEVPAANMVQALQGRAAGVDIARTGTTPGSVGQIRIRGNRSLTAGNDPLIVLDGIPFGGSINDINTDDIATLDILKDASATAIYGSRGSNGVLLITTKRGKSGKPVVSYNAFVGVSAVRAKYRMFNAQEFRAFRDISGYGAGASPYSADEKTGIDNGTDTDWQDQLYHKGYSNSHQLNVSGGTEQGQYSMGGSYYKEKGVIPGQSFERLSLRATLDQKIGSRVKVGLTTVNTLSYTNGENINVMFNTVALSPLTSAYLPDGSINIRPLKGTVDEFSTANPLTLQNKDAVVQRRRRIRTFNSLYGEVKILESLKYRINIGLDFRQDNYNSYAGINTIVAPGNTNASSTTAGITNGEAGSYVIENLLIFDKTFAEKHKVNFTALYSVQQDQASDTRFQATGVPLDYMQYYNILGVSGQVSAQTNGLTSGYGNLYSKRGLISYMARLNYSFNDRFLLTATVRRDGSSVLSPGHQYFVYPAASLGWNLQNENFIKSIKPISALKLRAGYGLTSNQSIRPYSTLGGLVTNYYNFGSNNYVGYLVDTLPNAGLKWESTATLNAGLDFGFFNNRITGSVDFYSQHTQNLLVQKYLPISNGSNSYLTNAAKTQGRGIEIALSAAIIQKENKGFNWSADVNFSVNREKIVQLEDPSSKQNVANGWFVGQPINVIYDYKKIGIWQTEEAAEAATFGQAVGKIKVADLNNDGKITADDRTVLGTFQPKWIGGLTNRFTFKGIDLSIVTFARMGNKIATTYYGTNSSGNGYSFFNSGRFNQLKVNYWTPDNPTNDFPMPLNSNNLPYSSTLNYFDGSFIKVRSINLGYTLPSSITSKAKISSVRVYVTAQNPFILYSPFVSNGYGIDPEGTATGQGLPPNGESQGVGVSSRAITVGLSAPSTRSYLIGINARF